MKDLKHIKRFNESNKNDISKNKINESKNIDIRVKDIINFLQSFDPETPVHLDKDGWQAYGNDSIDDIIRYVIDDSAITHRGDNYLTINN
jgi:hypothetical protein